MPRGLLVLVSVVLLASVAFATDHSEFIEGPFGSLQEVTQTCLACHDNVGDEIIHTRHWNWQGEPFERNGEMVQIGKRNLINNFCIAVESNWPRCTSCHIGVGWVDDSFDHSNPENIDCLICHDGSGTYAKIPTGGGEPVSTVDLVLAAQSVTQPTRRNCGICHFNGGGGTGVKHGDLDESLYDPTRELDVHMGGAEMECVDCHVTTNHKIHGSSFGSLAAGTNHNSCTQCHEGEIHSSKKINEHLDAVACEACHIPLYARGMPTKTWWDWSQAGQDKPVEEDEFGKELYSKKKGDFTWGKDLEPEYAWYNGEMDVTIIGDVVNREDGVVLLNRPHGSIDDPEAKLTPFRVMRGKQPADAENHTMIVPHLYGEKGFWKTFDWQEAAEIGMKAAKQPFSGKVEFVETEMYWPLNHMVAPKESALKCMACHGSRGRLDWEALGYEGDPMKVGGRGVSE